VIFLTNRRKASKIFRNAAALFLASNDRNLRINVLGVLLQDWFLLLSGCGFLQGQSYLLQSFVLLWIGPIAANISGLKNITCTHQPSFTPTSQFKRCNCVVRLLLSEVERTLLSLFLSITFTSQINHSESLISCVKLKFADLFVTHTSTLVGLAREV